jgi:hypothetical protein
MSVPNSSAVGGKCACSSYRLSVMIYSVDVNQLACSFVVEIGFRQAWPFLGFCDNRSTPAVEIRLFIDASWTIEAGQSRDRQRR